MATEIKIDGLAGLQQAIAAKKKAISQNALSRVVRQNAAEASRSAKRNAPVRTGELQRSITVKLDGYTTAIIAPYMDYAEYVELGTRFMQAQPYLGPALHAQEPIFIADLKKLVKKK